MAHPNAKSMERLLALDNSLEVWRVHVDALREQDRNARRMTPKQLDRLTQNIKKDGRLESLPFCALTEKDGDKCVAIVSGHHRVRAARAAGVTHIYVLVDTSGLSQSSILAKQLAHNAIEGTDDMSVVAEIWQDILDVQDKLETGLDPEMLGVALKGDDIGPALGVGFEYHMVSLAFLPHQLEAFEGLLERTRDQETVFVARDDQWESFRKVVKRMQKELKVRSVTVAVAIMVEAAQKMLDERIAENKKEAVASR